MAAAAVLTLPAFFLHLLHKRECSLISVLTEKLYSFWKFIGKELTFIGSRMHDLI